MTVAAVDTEMARMVSRNTSHMHDRVAHQPPTCADTDDGGTSGLTARSNPASWR